MDGQRRFAVIGTDARLAAAGRALARAGFAVGGPEQTALADYILLPLPLDESRTPLAELLRAAKPGALALGGKLSAQARQIAAEAGVELVDYFAREELILCNAIPTAEGCIGILMAERTRTLWNSAILLAGFGPVGQALGVRLAALGAQVTVAARRPAQRALAESFSLRAVDLARLEQAAPAFDTVVNTIPAPVLTEAVLAALRPGSLIVDLARLEQAAPAFDTVVNTIPAPVLTEAVLAALRPGSLIVDLASKPGGTDFAAARRLGHRAIHALSLPTACAPETAGEALARTVCEILAEREGTP